MTQENKLNPIITVDASDKESDYSCEFKTNDKDAIELALHAKYRIENGSIKIHGQVDGKTVMQKMLATICISYINQDRDFAAWRENNSSAVPASEREKYFLAKKLKSV